MSVLEYRSPDQIARNSFFRSLGWAVFLGMSWTWCVGMFLPILLLRDYGMWGYIAFAIPNILGAAAVGWINRTKEQSAQTTVSHAPMMLAFSAVTAAFQIFFALWIFSRIAPDWLNFAKATFAIALCAVSLPLTWNKAAGPIVAAVVCLVSIVCIVECFRTGELMSWNNISRSLVDYRPTIEIIPLAAATCFGFLLCPHLDLSFHYSRQDLSVSEARIAFTIGLGLIFTAMIVFSLLYFGALLMAMVELRLVAEVFVWFLSIYLMVQLAFTIGVHWQASFLLLRRSATQHFFYMAVGTSFVGFGCYLLRRYVHHKELEAGELIYRLFLGFYGLLFPAYVYLCMIPGRGRIAPTQRQWKVFALAVLIALPMFWMGFIERKMLWLLPGLSIVLFARLVIPKTKTMFPESITPSGPLAV